MKKRKVKIHKNILELLPEREYDHVNECYVYEDGTLMDIVKIKCKDLTNKSQDDIEKDMYVLTNFFRLYSPDIKLIAINIPTNCSEQIKFLEYKISKCTSEYCRKQLEVKKAEQEWIEKNRLNKEFYIMYFAKDIEEFKKNRDLIYERLKPNNLIENSTKKNKDMVLMKMNNKNVK